MFSLLNLSAITIEDIGYNYWDNDILKYKIIPKGTKFQITYGNIDNIKNNKYAYSFCTNLEDVTSVYNYEFELIGNMI